jgi:hypothetical protein
MLRYNVKLSVLFHAMIKTAKINTKMTKKYTTLQWSTKKILYDQSKSTASVAKGLKAKQLIMVCNQKSSIFSGVILHFACFHTYQFQYQQ